MSEKMQDIIRDGIDANALALSFLRLGKFEDAVSFFKEALDTGKESPVTLLGLLCVHLKSKTFADYVLGINPGYNQDEFNGEAFATYSDIVALLFKVLEGDVRERFSCAMDLYLCTLLAVGDFTLFAKICPSMPKAEDDTRSYEYAKQYTVFFDAIGKKMSAQPFDMLCGQIFDRLKYQEQKKYLTKQAIEYFTKQKIRGGIASWYGRLFSFEDTTVEELQQGVDDMLALSMADGASILLSQILLRDPDNENAKRNSLCITLQKHINAANYAALCEEKEAVIVYLDTIDKTNKASVVMLLDLLAPVSSKVVSALGHFDLLDTVLTRLYELDKSDYAKHCINIANDYLQNSLFDLAKFYCDNALPHAGRSAHKVHFTLLLIALKCKNEDEHKKSLDFTKSMEEYRSLLFAVRDDEKLLKHYSDLADEVEKTQIAMRDAQTILTIVSEEDAQIAAHRRKNRLVSVFVLLVESMLFALGVFLYFNLPFAFSKSIPFILIPFALCIAIFFIYFSYSNKRKAADCELFPYKKADFCADAHNQQTRAMIPNAASWLAILAVLFVAFIVAPGMVSRSKPDGFGFGYLYEINDNGELEVVLRGRKNVYYVPEQIKGVDVGAVSVSFPESSEVIFESMDIYKKCSYSIYGFEDNNISVVIQKGEKISAYVFSTFDCVYYNGTMQEFRQDFDGDTTDFVDVGKNLFVKGDSGTAHTWRYSLSGIPKRT